ncbi:WD40 repeat-like protein [Gyrodon lividus]|nr:WD40 repeat-like protein [Gyrodon lividus]
MTENSLPIALHRCRFVDYSPSPITALAFPPSPLPSLRTRKAGKERERDRVGGFGTLVVGHANGNIDLLEWTGQDGEPQAPQAWHIRKTLPGPCPSKVDSVALTIRYPDTFPSDNLPSCSDLRLFSSGGGSELLEWDIARSSVRRTISSQGGSIWSMAANPASTMLALGCEDGSVRLLSLVADTLQHHRRFDRVKTRILSIAWGPPIPRQPKPKTNSPTGNKIKKEEDSGDDSDDEEDEWADSWLVTGGSDSSLNKWDVATGRPTDRMGTDKMKGERTLVWTVGVLADGTIISGDSLGTVKFWDLTTCTQIHSFVAHGADVLCLTIGPDGTTVFTSGVDQKIVQFNYVTAGTSSTTLSASVGRWIQSASRRMHSHDVRALAMWPPYSALPPAHRRKPSPGLPCIAPILVSGGLDMSVVLTPALPTSVTTSTVAARVVNPLATSVAATFEDSYYRRIPYYSVVSISRKARLVSCMHETGLNIWRVLDIPSTAMVIDGMDSSTDPESREGWERVLEMELSVHTNLIASALSDDGRWLVASDLYETKLFELSKTHSGDVKPSRVRSLTSVLEAHIPTSGLKEPRSTGGSCFAFTPDSSKMVIASATTSFILVLDLSTEQPNVLRRFDQHRKLSSFSGGRIVRGSIRSQSQDADDNGNGDEITPESNGLPSVVRMAVSPDGQWLATSDDLCRTFVFNLDSVQYHTTLPSLPHPPNVMTFTPERPQLLMTVLPNNTIHIYDVEHSEVPIWAHDLNSRIPKQLFGTPDPVVGVTFEPATPPPPRPLVNGDVEMTDVSQNPLPLLPTSLASQKEAVFWGSSWLCKLKLDWLGKYTEPRKRRKSEVKHQQQHQGFAPRPDLQNSAYEARNLRMVTHYRPILALDFLGPGEMMLVERPLVDVLSKLPPAFFKPKYGQT